MLLHKTQSLGSFAIGAIITLAIGFFFAAKTEPLHADASPVIVRSNIPYTPSSKASEAMIKQRASSMNAFAFELYRGLLKSDSGRNVVFSPLSIQGAFSLLYPATADATGKEISSTMHFLGQPASYHESMKGYLLHLDNIFAEKFAGKRFQWHMANNLWVDKTYGLQPKYMDTVRAYYNAQVIKLDLKSSPLTQEDSRRFINNYVEKQTNSLIKDLLPANSLGSDTATVLTNAVYMLADWADPFISRETHKDNFYLPEGVLSVDMMQRTGIYEYMQGDDYAALSMRYVGDKLALLIVLPETGIKLEDFSQTWDNDKLALTLQQLGSDRVTLSLPKFTFSWGSRSLRGPLAELGLQSLFLRGGNPLPRLLTLNGLAFNNGSAIQDVYHQAKIVVDEKGTEAAAATAVTVIATSARPSEPPKEFKVSRPAMFVIYDEKYHGILFMGQLVNPLAR